MSHELHFNKQAIRAATSDHLYFNGADKASQEIFYDTDYTSYNCYGINRHNGHAIY